MNRIRIVIAFSLAVAALGALATVSSAANKKLYVTMSGKQEKPTGDPNGTGTAVLTVTSSRVCYDIRPRGAGSKFGAGHIHIGARGKVGGILIALFAKSRQVSGGRITGCSATVKAADLANVKSKPGGFYLNIHNSAFPAGAVRGQLTAKKPR